MKEQRWITEAAENDSERRDQASEMEDEDGDVECRFVKAMETAAQVAHELSYCHDAATGSKEQQVQAGEYEKLRVLSPSRDRRAGGTSNGERCVDCCGERGVGTQKSELDLEVHCSVARLHKTHTRTQTQTPTWAPKYLAPALLVLYVLPMPVPRRDPARPR